MDVCPDRIIDRSDEDMVVWLPAEPLAVRRARALAVETLYLWGLGHLACDTELIVSELVTNAVRHAHSPARLRLAVDRSTLLCEVSDNSPVQPRLTRADADAQHGRGLLLVATLAQRWGVLTEANGKTIWAAQSLHP